MQIFYMIGVVVGIFYVYTIATWVVGFVFTALFGDKESDNMFTVSVVAWIAGMVAFIVLTIYTLNKFNLWR